MSTETIAEQHPLLTLKPYEAYTYAYPHKTAYRPLTPAIPLVEAWQHENRGALFLYVHIPFCEMRCGFCNLFTASNPAENVIESFLVALHRQAEVTQAELPDARFARIAFGGGTPTVLSVQQLERVLKLVRGLAAQKREDENIPFSVETSPATATTEKLALLRAHRVERISLGVQSFLDSEAAAVGRRQVRSDVETALQRVRGFGFPTLNIDLIYGIPGQTTETWRESLEAALAYDPEEIFLYPLYVRSLTGLGRANRHWEDQRLELFREGRDFLLEQGYSHVSMRMFRAGHANASDGPAYCAQDDGMVGLGCGARSYTRSLQYSARYAVGAAGVRSITEEYNSRTAEELACADYGFQLDADEQHRRFVALTLLNQSGLPLDGYERKFGSNVFEDLPQLRELEPLRLAVQEGHQLRLTMAGLELSDSIGPWLYSERVNSLMRSFALS
ncbi:MAG TPA: STM4012 family radical SAM protein [Candidatus Dormibacteraeota bacterium]|nr:STM4012 family radical SAM protein [Candidatus Dormibacteraeota bacterium]